MFFRVFFIFEHKRSQSTFVRSSVYSLSVTEDLCDDLVSEVTSVDFTNHLEPPDRTSNISKDFSEPLSDRNEGGLRKLQSRRVESVVGEMCENLPIKFLHFINYRGEIRYNPHQLNPPIPLYN